MHKIYQAYTVAFAPFMRSPIGCPFTHEINCYMERDSSTCNLYIGIIITGKINILWSTHLFLNAVYHELEMAENTFVVNRKIFVTF